jgi:hypothetical protein
MKLLALLILPMFALNSAMAEEKKVEEKPATKLVCHGPHEDRTMEIVTKGDGCILNYTKQKETKVMAHASHDVKPCQIAMQKIRDRLESGNFACE